MVPFSKEYVFDSPSGPKTFLDLFEGCNQLIVFQFMDRGPEEYCPGCTWFTNNVPTLGLDGLKNNDVAWATVSNMPHSQIEEYKALKGWTIPFYSSHGTSFSEDCGAGGGFLFSAVIRDGDQIFRTYSTRRAVWIAWSFLTLSSISSRTDVKRIGRTRLLGGVGEGVGLDSVRSVSFSNHKLLTSESHNQKVMRPVMAACYGQTTKSPIGN